MYIKKLVGKKCFLSPIALNDAEQFASWLNDQELVQFLTLATSVITTETERGFLEALSREHNYGIVDLKTDKLLGVTGLLNIDHIHASAEIGIFIGNKKYWNNGYGTEALCLLIDYAYKILNMHNITLKVFAFNARAISCYEKVGFKKAGCIREAILRNRQRHDIILMDLLPQDFFGA